jgi:hypothetical protein
MKWLYIKKKVLIPLTSFLLMAGCNTTHKAMDIVSPGFIVDDNFLMKNPVWGLIADKRATTPPFPSLFCDCNSGDENKWTTAPDCTSQDVHYNKPYSGNYCPDGGHMNYFPITYESTICWGDHSGWDDDYNFRLRRKDLALNTAGWDGLQVEFDSDETVDDWDNTDTWWDDFHHNKVDESDDAARDAIDGKFAIVIGEAGIDLEHGCHIELHPVYAMFVHIKDDPNDDQWAFFVRNWGDEGYCGNNQVYYHNPLASDNSITVRIPHENAVPAGFTHNIRSISDANHKTLVLFDFVQDALLLTFNLDVPEEHTTIVGDINIQWSATNNRTLQPRGDAADNLICQGLGVQSQPQTSSDSSDIEAKMLKLDSLSKKELFKAIDGRFKNKMLIRLDSTVVKKSALKIKTLSRSKLKAIDYSRMSYMVPDTATSKMKKERAMFIKEFLKGKGIE